MKPRSLHHVDPLYAKWSNRDSNLVSLNSSSHTKLHKILDPSHGELSDSITRFQNLLSANLVQSWVVVNQQYELLQSFFINYNKLPQNLRIIIGNKKKQGIIDHLEQYEKLMWSHPYFSKNMIKSIDVRNDDFVFMDLLDIDYKIVQAITKFLYRKVKQSFPLYHPHKIINYSSWLIIPIAMMGRSIRTNHVDPSEFSDGDQVILSERYLKNNNSKIPRDEQIRLMLDRIGSSDMNIHNRKRSARKATNDKYIIDSESQKYRFELQVRYFDQFKWKINEIWLESVRDHFTRKTYEQAMYDTLYYEKITWNAWENISDDLSLEEYHQKSSKIIGQLADDIIDVLNKKYYFFNN